MRTLPSLLLALSSLTPLPLQSQEGLRVYISVDMEGVVGVVSGDHLGTAGFEYQKARQWLTAEVNAAIGAAKAAGATHIVVSDSHGNGENILLDLLPSDILLVRSWPRPLGMMQGIDESFDAALFIGYHASTNNTEGVRAHTMSSGNYTAIRINGVEVPEAVINAGIAGHFGVPVVMMSGDDASIEEATSHLGDLEGAVLKWSYGFHSAMTVMPEVGNRIIGETVATALNRIDDFEPYRIDGPIRMEVSFKNYRPVEILAYLPLFDRVDSHTIGFTVEDMVEASMFLQFISGYGSSITP